MAVHKRRLAITSLVLFFPGEIIAGDFPAPSYVAGTILATRFNTTGKIVSLPAAVKEDQEHLGEVSVSIDPNDRISVERAGLLAILANRVTPVIHARLAALASPGGNIPLEQLQDIDGLAVAFNPNAVELSLKTSPTTTQATDVELRKRRASRPNQAPANTSAYVNVTTMIDQGWGGAGMAPLTGVNFNYDGAARYSGVVLESDGGLDGPLDSFLCPTGAQCSYAHQNGFKRRGTRLVKDFTESSTRLMVGDVTYTGQSLQRGGDFAGIGIRHNPTAFGKSRETAGVSTLQLESPADVDVIINGVQTQRLRLRTGTYNLRNLPLGAGTNDIELQITTTSGERRTVRVAAINDESLLAPGKTEWAAAGGYASYELDGQRTYLTDQPGANAYFRFGITDQLTGEIHTQADALLGMTGASITAASPFGLWTFGLGTSATIADPLGALDYAASLNWQYMPPARDSDHRHTIRASAEYRGLGFHTPGEFVSGYGGILYPTYAPALKIDANWTTAYAEGISTAVSGRYIVPNAISALPGALQLDYPVWNVDASLSGPITESTSATAWVGYGNSGLLSFLENAYEPQFFVGLRLSFRPDKDTDVQIGADTTLTNADLYVSRRSRNAAGEWSSTVTMAQTPGYGVLANTSINNRSRYGSTSINHSAQFDSMAFADLGTPINMRTSLRTTSSVAYAGGSVAVGAPIRDAFAIIRPHESLPDSEVIVGSIDKPVATGTRTFPALLENLSTGSDINLPVDATNLPTGYGLGDGTLAITPEYKAGYAIDVGSANAMSAYGTLLKHNGKPLSLTTAVAAAGDRRIDLFTNSKGKFGIEGLGPGQWMITAQSPAGPISYAFTVAAGATALINTGPLLPTNEGPPHDPEDNFVSADASAGWLPR